MVRRGGVGLGLGGRFENFGAEGGVGIGGEEGEGGGGVGGWGRWV